MHEKRAQFAVQGDLNDLVSGNLIFLRTASLTHLPFMKKQRSETTATMSTGEVSDIKEEKSSVPKLGAIASKAVAVQVQRYQTVFAASVSH